jgi:hypothetical protein
MSGLPDVSYHQAVKELAALSRWSNADVQKQPRDAAWVAYAWIAKCRERVEAGDR